MRDTEIERRVVELEKRIAALEENPRVQLGLIETQIVEPPQTRKLRELHKEAEQARAEFDAADSEWSKRYARFQDQYNAAVKQLGAETAKALLEEPTELARVRQNERAAFKLRAELAEAAMQAEKAHRDELARETERMIRSW